MAPTILLWLYELVEEVTPPLQWPGGPLRSLRPPQPVRAGSEAPTRGGLGVYLQHLSPWEYRI